MSNKLGRPLKRSSKYKDGYVYLIRVYDLLLACGYYQGESITAAFPLYKIGLTHNLKQRLQTLSAWHDHHIDVVHTIYSNDIQALEEALHTRFVDKWFKDEYFDLDPSDVEEIKNWPA